VAIAIFILTSTLSSLGVRLLGIYLLPKRKGRRERHNLFRELTRLFIASFAAWITYAIVPEERSFTLAVIVGSFIGAFLSFSE